MAHWNAPSSSSVASSVPDVGYHHSYTHFACWLREGLDYVVPNHFLRFAFQEILLLYFLLNSVLLKSILNVVPHNMPKIFHSPGFYSNSGLFLILQSTSSLIILSTKEILNTRQYTHISNVSNFFLLLRFKSTPLRHMGEWSTHRRI